MPNSTNNCEFKVVITWLERGDCSKKNANVFYSMIQSTNSHVRRLLTEKSHYEDELKKAKDLLKGRMQGILLQCKYFFLILITVTKVNLYKKKFVM